MRTRALIVWYVGGQKNGLRHVRDSAVGAGTTAGNAEHEICPVAIIAFTSSWRCDAFSAVGAARESANGWRVFWPERAVHRAFCPLRRRTLPQCDDQGRGRGARTWIGTRSSDLEKHYMREQLAKRSGKARPKVIGIDEVSVRKGHEYRIVVSDLEKHRPIWFGGAGSVARRAWMSFIAFWAKSTPTYPPGGDGHVEAVSQLHVKQRPAGSDFVRQVPHHAPSRRGTRSGAQDRSIARLARQGPHASSRARNIRCCRTAEPQRPGAQEPEALLAANKRLNTAYLLKESFGQLWDYNSEAWARKLLRELAGALKWQRLKPYEKFADMIDRHWDGIAAYCKPENKVVPRLRRGSQQQNPRHPAPRLRPSR